MSNFSCQNTQNNFFQCRHNLMLQTQSQPKVMYLWRFWIMTLTHQTATQNSCLSSWVETVVLMVLEIQILYTVVYAWTSYLTECHARRLYSLTKINWKSVKSLLSWLPNIIPFQYFDSVPYSVKSFCELSPTTVLLKNAHHSLPISRNLLCPSQIPH